VDRRIGRGADASMGRSQPSQSSRSRPMAGGGRTYYFLLIDYIWYAVLYSSSVFVQGTAFPRGSGTHKFTSLSGVPMHRRLR
jgi:hypothetical protein